MTLKQVVLNVLSWDHLKDLCNELELEADRRSDKAMAKALQRSKKAKPERMIAMLTVAQLREALTAFGQPADGSKAELVKRLLAAGGRETNTSASDNATGAGVAAQHAPLAQRRSTTGAPSMAEQYLHVDTAVQRPDAGVQDQFTTRKPPKTYRFDSSLDPAMSWDEQRERELGEWLIALIVRTAKEGERAVFAEPHEWKGGGVRVESVADAAKFLQDLSRPFLNWAGKAERHQMQVPTTPLFVHERHSTKAVLDGIRHRKARGQTLDLFGDTQLGVHEKLEAYEQGMSRSLLKIAQQASSVLSLCGLGVQFKVWADGVPGLMGQQSRPQDWQLLVGLEPAEALGRFHHAGGRPT